MVSAAAFVIIVAGLKAAAVVLVPLLLAVFIVIVITPLFFGLQRLGLPSGVALIILILALILIGSFGVGILTNSLNDFATKLPGYQERLTMQIDTVMVWLQSKGIDLPEKNVSEMINAKTALKLVGNTVSAMTGLLGKGFMILLVIIFILLEVAMLPAKVRALPGMTEATWQGVGQVVDNVRQYMGMKSLLSGLTGVLVGVMLSLFGVDAALLLGIFAFLFNFVPNIGSFLAAIPGIILTFIQFGFAKAAIVAAFYIVINVLIGNFLEPRVMGKGLGLSPMIIVISLILWGWVLGPVGMLLSVPLTMTFKIILENIEETRGLGLLLGAAPPPPKKK